MVKDELNSNSQDCKCCSCCSGHRSFWNRHKGKIIILSILFFFVFLPLWGFFSFLGAVGEEVKKQEQMEAVISGSGEDKIAVVNIDGVIVEKDPPYTFGLPDSSTSSRKIKKVLNEIKADDKVKGVLLYVNSPGGSAAASEEIYRDILSFKKSSNKPVYAYFSDIAASGGLYVAMASDKIYANPSTITGSIGVIISYLNFSELASKYGVRNIVYKSGELKDILSEFREPTPQEQQIMQGLVNDTYLNFVSVVREGRKLPEDRVRELADGRVFSAKGAKEAKLIDEIGTFNDSVDSMMKSLNIQDASVIEYGKPDFFETLLGTMSQKFNVNLIPTPNSGLDSSPGTKLLYLYNP